MIPFLTLFLSVRKIIPFYRLNVANFCYKSASSKYDSLQGQEFKFSYLFYHSIIYYNIRPAWLIAIKCHYYCLRCSRKKLMKFVM